MASLNKVLLIGNVGRDPEALKAAFAEHKDAPGFAVTWKQHGESLKAAAAQAEPA